MVPRAMARLAAGCGCWGVLLQAAERLLLVLPWYCQWDRRGTFEKQLGATAALLSFTVLCCTAGTCCAWRPTSSCYRQGSCGSRHPQRVLPAAGPRRDCCRLQLSACMAHSRGRCHCMHSSPLAHLLCCAALCCAAGHPPHGPELDHCPVLLHDRLHPGAPAHHPPPQRHRLDCRHGALDRH